MSQAWPIETTEQGGRLRLAWDNRQVRKDNFVFVFMVLFWLVWAPLTVFMTGVMVYSLIYLEIFSLCFFLVWCVFGWLGTLLIPYALLQRSWSEWVEVSQEAVTCGSRGLFAPGPKAYPIDKNLELALAWYWYGNDHEGMATLNMIRTKWGFRQRHMFGYWLASPLKQEVFERIRDFVEANQVPLKLTVLGEPPPRSNDWVPQPHRVTR